MTKPWSVLSGYMLPLLVSCAQCGGPAETTQAETASAELKPEAEPIEPLPEKVEFDRQKMELGRALYHDTILSGDRTVSCASCHMLSHGGAEPRKTSLGIKSQVGPINSPTVLNSRYNFRQFWNGRAATLEEQAEGPVANAKEMGASWPEVQKRIQNSKHYAPLFQATYQEPPNKANITHAIAEYERSLVTPSRVDAFLRGQKNALSKDEQEGYSVFKEVGCTSCHQGINVGGSMYQKMGLVRDYFKDRGGELTAADMGRYDVTKKESDKHLFKVPSLRNVELTPPYLHDGTRETLEETVKLMGTYQLGRDLSAEQISKIVAFLKALTGQLPDHAKMPKALALR